jgi:hypothetical protein
MALETADPRGVVQQEAGRFLDPDRFDKHGSDEYEKIAKAAAPTNEEKEAFQAYFGGVMTRLLAPGELMQAKGDALELEKGLFDFEVQIGGVGDPKDMYKLSRLVHGVFLLRGRGGRARLGDETGAYYNFLQSQNQEGMPGLGSDAMMGSDAYSERTRLLEAQRLEPDPHGRIARLLVALQNAEKGGQELYYRLLGWLDSPRFANDLERDEFRLMQAVGKAVQVQAGSTLDHAADTLTVEDVPNPLLLAFQDFGFPVVVEKCKQDGSHESYDLRIVNACDAYDIFSRNPSLRELYMSHSPLVKRNKGELLFGRHVLRDLLGVDVRQYSQNPDLYRMWALQFPEGKDTSYQLTSGDVDEKRLMPWIYDADDTMVGSVPYNENMLAIRSESDALKAQKWVAVQVETFIRAFGMSGIFDPGVLGQLWSYVDRPALVPEVYDDFIYSKGMEKLRPYFKSYYYSVLGENMNTLIPALRRASRSELSRDFLGGDLQALSVDDLRYVGGFDHASRQRLYKEIEKNANSLFNKQSDPERALIMAELLREGGQQSKKAFVERSIKNELISQIMDMRFRVIRFVYGDFPLRPWLAVYLDTVAKKQKVTIGRDVIVNGGGRIYTGGAVEINSKFFNEVPMPNEITMDFNNYGQALEFLIYNCSQKGDVRTMDMMTKVVNGMVSNGDQPFMGTTLARLFMGWSPLPALEDMAHNLAHHIDQPEGGGRRVVPPIELTQIEQDILDGKTKPPYMTQLEFNKLNNKGRKLFGGLFGLKVLVDHYSTRSLFFEGLPRHVLWQWVNYLKGARKSADARYAINQAFNLAAKPVFENARFVEPYGAHKEMESLLKAVAEEGGLWPFMDPNVRAEAAVDLVVGLVEGMVVQKKTKLINTPKRRFVVNKVMSQATINPEQLSNPMGMADLWKHGMSDTKHVRPELGFYTYTVLVDSLGTKKTVFMGPGHMVVFDSEQDKLEEFPNLSAAQQQYGARALDVTLFNRALDILSDAQALTGNSHLILLKYLLYVNQGRLPFDPDMTDMENKVLLSQTVRK